MSSTKPEVHNVSQRRQGRTEPWPHATCIKNLAKFGPVIFETCDQRDRQTYSSWFLLTLTAYNSTTFPPTKVTIED